jgi:hypothetical protein
MERGRTDMSPEDGGSRRLKRRLRTADIVAAMAVVAVAAVLAGIVLVPQPDPEPQPRPAPEERPPPSDQPSGPRADVPGDVRKQTGPPPRPTLRLYVDGSSLGGRCDDGRAPSEARSLATPWCSLGRAIAAAPPNSAVEVRAGSYAAPDVRDRAQSAWVTVRPYRSERVTLAGVQTENAGFVRFEGFRIKGLVTIGPRSKNVQIVDNDISPNGILMRPAENILIEGNDIHDLRFDPKSPKPSWGYGMRILATSSGGPPGVYNLAIRGNRFRGIPADGIQMGLVFDVLIEKNEFSNIRPFVDPSEHSDSIQVNGSSQNVVVRDNLFYDARGIIVKPVARTNTGTSTGMRIENNLFARLFGWALNLYDAPGLRLINNTVWDTRGGVLLREAPGNPATMEDVIAVNNIFDRFSAAPRMLALEDYNLIGTGSRRGRHDISGSPLFRSPRRVDYRLRARSPGIDAGLSTRAPRRDRLGKRRFDDPRTPNLGGGRRRFYDIGAHEYTRSRR